jgi:stress response protein YsnF
MVSEQEISAAIGGTAYGSDGGKLGTIEAFFADDRTGTPSWVSISTGLFGTRQSVVPVAGATFTDGTLRLPVTADAVRSAPVMAGEHLDPADEEVLRRHYGVAGATPFETPAEPSPAVQSPAVESAPVESAAVDSPAVAPGAMTRSEEQLRVGTERVATTRARLVKYVVTEEVQITVPIRREEIRVEQVPVDAEEGSWVGESLDVPPASAGVGTPASGGLPDEIVLYTERPVVTVEVVPVERVRLRVDTVEGQETVSGQVQREQIVVDQDTAPGVSPR